MVNRIPTRPISMQGFSRQESLGILAVIAMSAAIAGASYAHKISEAKQTVLREDCNVISQAMNSYRRDKGHTPASLDDLIQSGYLAAPPEGVKMEDCSW